MDGTFAGITTSVAIPSGDAAGDAYAWIASADLGGPSLGFTLFDGTGSVSCGGSSTSDAAVSCGTLSFAAVTAPEPSSVALMLLGVGLLFVMRKRIGQHLPQAS